MNQSQSTSYFMMTTSEDVQPLAGMYINRTYDLKLTKNQSDVLASELNKKCMALLCNSKAFGKEDYILPYEFQIVGYEPANKVLRLKKVEETVDKKGITKTEARFLLEKDLDFDSDYGKTSYVNQQISDAIYRKIVFYMNAKEEQIYLQTIKNYVNSSGYYFDDETIENYHVSFKTRPFVVLGGLSGTGKTKLTRLYAEALGAMKEEGEERYLRIAVRPNWDDDHHLLGYFNSISNRYHPETVLEFLLRAHHDKEHLYFLCLDEMNLARIEYYFSQFLSALEGEQENERYIHLMPQGIHERIADEAEQKKYPYRFPLPTNVLFTGTINIDETTQSLSDKVIDRANTLDFFRIDLAHMPNTQMYSSQKEAKPLTVETWYSFKKKTPDSRYRQELTVINHILNKANIGLGYRACHDIEMYIANSKYIMESHDAFDIQVKQRILPRVRGGWILNETMDELLDYTQKEKLSRSYKHLEEMQQRLKHHGHTTYWR